MSIVDHNAEWQPNMYQLAIEQTKRFIRDRLVSRAAQEQDQRDRHGLPPDDIAISEAIDLAVQWLLRAQECSTSQDGGVAHHFSVERGWSPSYPETTGYIVPTLLDYGERRGNDRVIHSASRMLGWLESIQMESGAFQAGHVLVESRTATTFNTGQILMGLAAGARRSERYLPAMRRAADWLLDTQDSDGCWRRFPSPLTAAGDKSYEVHVAWGLLQASAVENDKAYAEAALRNVNWALGKQASNGWLADCCTDNPRYPLTHTLGYALRGIIEAYIFSREPRYLAAARSCADFLRLALGPDGWLPGRIGQDGRGPVGWACLTGSVQIAHCWLLLYTETGDRGYLSAGRSANAFVRRTVSSHAPPDQRGAVRGSFPFGGAYVPYAYPNWATKFYIDSLTLEASIAEQEENGSLG